MADETLTQLDQNLWVATRRLKLIVGDIGTRMTVIRVGNGLLLHSPVPLDDATKRALDATGQPRWAVGPSKVHSLFLGDYARGYPSIEIWGAPGLAEKRRDLKFDRVVDEAAAKEAWGDEVRVHLFQGLPMLNEIVFLHRPSRTLVLTDLAFNVHPGPGNRARFFHWLVGAVGRFGPHRLVRLGIRDRAAARHSLETILAWDFDRIIVTHGEVLEKDGRAKLEAGFSFLAVRN